MKIIIRDRNEDFISNVRNLLQHQDTSFNEIVSAQCSDIFLDENWNAVVSPANSFGFMNGGIDQIYINKFGQQLEDRVREHIQDTCNGELLVGQSFWLPVNENDNRALVVAPTMRVPQRIIDPVDVYLATKAAVRCGAVKGEILLIPGMGTGVGMVRYDTAAQNMIIGIRDGLYGMAQYNTCAQAWLDNEKFKVQT